MKVVGSFFATVFCYSVRMVCPWPFLAALDTTETAPPESGNSGKTSVQVLAASDDLDLSQLPPKVIMGDSVRVKVTQKEYECGILDCKYNLHGRLTLHKGDQPLLTQALKLKLAGLWPTLRNWNVLPLGKGFFEFQFSSMEDMRKVWALRVMNLKPGFLRFFCWTKAFTTHTQV